MTRETLNVRVDDVELAVDVRGAGPPLLFVHGFPFNRTMWRHQVAGLTRWRRIAPDLRGAGASSAPADGYSIARYADDVAAVLDAVGASQAVVCGLSMGGYILFELLRRHPERVRAAVFCDTKAEPDTAEARRGRDDLIAVAQRHGQAAVAERLLPLVLAPQTFEGQPEVVRDVREMIERGFFPPGLSQAAYYARSHIHYGHPEEVIASLRGDTVLPHATELICQVHPGHPTPAQVVTALERTAREVAPPWAGVGVHWLLRAAKTACGVACSVRVAS